MNKITTRPILGGLFLPEGSLVRVRFCFFLLIFSVLFSKAQITCSNGATIYLSEGSTLIDKGENKDFFDKTEEADSLSIIQKTDTTAIIHSQDVIVYVSEGTIVHDPQHQLIKEEKVAYKAPPKKENKKVQPTKPKGSFPPQKEKVTFSPLPPGAFYMHGASNIKNAISSNRNHTETILPKSYKHTHFSYETLKKIDLLKPKVFFDILINTIKIRPPPTILISFIS